MFAQSRDRTDDLRVTNALLYQLSYLGKKNKKNQYRIGEQKSQENNNHTADDAFLAFPLKCNRVRSYSMAQNIILPFLYNIYWASISSILKSLSACSAGGC